MLNRSALEFSSSLSLELGRLALFKHGDYDANIPGAAKDYVPLGDTHWASSTPDQSAFPFLSFLKAVE